MKTRSVMVLAAAAAVALSPVAASANTRAGDAAVSLAPIGADAARIASPVDGSEEALGNIPAWVIALLVALGIIIHETTTSPGIFD